jgi:hypothetical protein
MTDGRVSTVLLNDTTGAWLVGDDAEYTVDRSPLYVAHRPRGVPTSPCSSESASTACRIRTPTFSPTCSSPALTSTSRNWPDTTATDAAGGDLRD